MKRIKIYLEGAGDYKEQKAALRRGMGDFLGSLKQSANEKNIAFDVVACGGRQKAFEAFKDAFEKQSTGTLVTLLVDAEEAVISTPRRHLIDRDKWSLNGVAEDAVHLMTQTMETWIVADPEAVESYYEQHFVPCLPKGDDLEKVPKVRIEDLLERATKQTQKGKYHKTEHAPKLFALINPLKVRQRCGFCERLFTLLLTRIQEA